MHRFKTKASQGWVCYLSFECCCFLLQRFLGCFSLLLCLRIHGEKCTKSSKDRKIELYTRSHTCFSASSSAVSSSSGGCKCNAKSVSVATSMYLAMLSLQNHDTTGHFGSPKPILMINNSRTLHALRPLLPWAALFSLAVPTSHNPCSRQRL